MAKELKLGSGTVGLGLREWKEIDQPRESVAVGLGREGGQGEATVNCQRVI
jgi:hypothetical protein